MASCWPRSLPSSATPASPGPRFVFLPERAWPLPARQPDAGAAATVADAGQPVSLFIDEPTGFFFNYVVDQGWVFAGKMDAAR